MRTNRLSGFSSPEIPPTAPRTSLHTQRGSAETSRAVETPCEESGRKSNEDSDRAEVLLCQLIDSGGDVYEVNQSTCLQGNTLPFPRSNQQTLSRSDGYKIQQAAYLAKIRNMLTPRSLSEGLKEFDSTKNNPPKSESARFGTKPDTNVYKYRLVSWGGAGSGIPLTNNPYSVRPQNAPRVDEGFQRKSFKMEQRESISNAQYKNVIKDQLNTGLHNSHAFASRFLGPESSANIAPATFTNYKNNNWGQGEMQSHLEHALSRMEVKARENGISIFLRCTDYLGKFGELQARKLKVFLSDPVTDKQTLAEKGTVKETILGTFYLPGMIREPSTGDLIEEYKKQVSQLERATDLAVTGKSDRKAAGPAFEVHYKYGICAQDLKPLSEQKLMFGKINRSNDGLNTVLQRIPKNRSIQNNKMPQERNVVRSSSHISNAVLDRINELKENPRVLKRGEEVWETDEVEAVLDHIRRPDLDKHIQAQVDQGQLSLQESLSFCSQGLSPSSSGSSISSKELSGDTEKRTDTAVELEFDGVQDSPEPAKPPASDSSHAESAGASLEDHSVQSGTIVQTQPPPWLEGRSKKKRGT